MTVPAPCAWTILELLARSGTPVEEKAWAEGDHLFRQGYPTGGILIQTEGLAKSYLNSENGAEILVALLGPGELLGDIEYFRACPALCSVVALERVTTKLLAAERIPAAKAAIPDFDLLLGRSLAARLAENALRFERNFGYSLEYNVLVAALSRLGAPERPIRKTELRDYLGISIRHLNRVLASLEGQGLISATDGVIRVADQSAARRRLAREKNA